MLHLDFETRSTVDLSKSGLDVYAKHPTTEVICTAFALDDAPVRIWVPEAINTHWPPLDWIENGGLVVAHNAQFEFAIWNEILVPRFGFPELRIEQMRCTMAMAYAMALPGSLDAAAKAVGLAAEKDQGGRRLMLQMCKPRRIDPDGTIVWWEDADRLARLAEYCRQDVEVERELCKVLLPLSDTEQAIWVLDQKINRRGIYADTATAHGALQIVDREKERLDREMDAVTDGEVTACSQATALTEWLKEMGVNTAGVAKADVADLLSVPGLPPDIEQALRLRQEASKSSTAKIKKLLESVSPDGRVRYTMQYHGAATGRWAGRKIQVQNFPRGSLKPHEVDAACELIRAVDVDMLDLLYGKPLDVLSSCLRGLLTAAPGRDLIAVDFSAIEARVIAWLAGEERVLEIFRGDGKIYEDAASGIYRVPIEEVTAAQRQIGKVAILALGYQGGVGAFQTMARGYGVQVTDEEADAIKNAWREANPKIVQFWYALEDAAIQAVLKPGTETKAGFIRFKAVGSFLWCKLPSGRRLCYPYPRIGEITTPWGKPKFALLYWFQDPLTKTWREDATYGGTLAENVTQAVARDLLADAMRYLDTAGYEIVMHVHDEVVIEIDENEWPGILPAIEYSMCHASDWAEGLPMAAEGWRGKRYRK